MDRNSIKRPIVIGIVGASALLGVSTGAVAGGLFSPGPDGVAPSADAPAFSAPEPSYAENRSGLTYGSALEASSPEQEPDLIQVVATNGREGYVFKSQLDEASGANQEFDSPADAVAWQRSVENRKFALPVYTSDGITKIGEFVIDFGAAEDDVTK